MNAALYIRVSTDDQLEYSPDAQKRSLLEYAKKNSMIVDEDHIFIDEGISGTTAKKRPAFMRMIATAKKKPKPFGAILVHKFDRFARSREDSVVYKSLLRKDCGIKVISITEQLEEDKFSVILEAMLEAMAEYYSLNLSDEVMKGMSEKARHGGVQSSPPYGYDIIDNKYMINKDESEIVKIVFDKFVNEDENYRQICNYLNSLGVKNKRGNSFENRIITYMLENPVYTGVVRWNYATQKGSGRKLNPSSEWIISKGAHEPIISEQLFNAACEKIRSNSITNSYKRPLSSEYKHWLGGLFRCSVCGGTLTYSAYSKSSLTPNSKYKGYFSCNKFRKGSCNTNTRISVRNAEIQVIQTLKKTGKLISMDSEVIPVDIKIKSNSDEQDLLKRQLDKTGRKYDIAKNAYLNEVDTLEEYKKNKADIKAEEDAILFKLNKTIDKKEVTDLLAGKITNAIKILEDDKADLKTKNITLKDFIETIVVNKTVDTLEFKCYL